ncbi:hypothetical protein CASFOL_030310 [Castilleja foliolosa]|uniref:Reverse transcriptase n=1 Tax=Castilleja foliolosa TaxID=1961234 RepID=A0ABD3C9K4_9LAMI
MLDKEEKLGNFRGIKISRSSPSVSHLLYADDLVVFCRAKVEDALCINKVLNGFKNWSSQEPNSDKSMVHFSNNTNGSLKTDILETLGFKECDHKIKHLGMSFCKPHSRKAAHKDVMDKIENSLKSWKVNLLSQAGRSIMVKAVAQSLPAYHMSVSLFPKELCHKLDSLFKRFWWGSNKNGNSLMLKSWDALCSPKAVGGMGFRRMEDLNIALVSKLAWMVCSNKDTLWVKLLYSKYMRGKSFLSDNLNSPGCSWTWKDIVSCKNLIKKGALYPINLNSNVLIWSEPWIPTIPDFTPLDTLNALFPLNIVQEILKIQISQRYG